MAEKVIFALAAIAAIFLFLWLRSSLTEPNLDPTRAPTTAGIRAVIVKTGGTCDSVDSIRQLGNKDDWSYYLARCHDGGRYVYFQNPIEKQLGAMTCNREQALGYFCPE